MTLPFRSSLWFILWKKLILSHFLSRNDAECQEKKKPNGKFWRCMDGACHYNMPG
jgi:hypothetical protein